MNYMLEVIAFNIQSVVVAQQSGAHRIELCDNPAEGGTTQSYGMIKMAREKTSLLLYPIIRPRGGDFLYTAEEFEIMKKDIQLCKELQCDGVVIGLLQPDGSIDKKRTSELVEVAYPLGVTFHRAFDRAANPFEALEDVISIGCERILTSGLKPTALEGADTLGALVKQANDRIIIMPGSGVRANNIQTIAQRTGATEFHSSARNDQPSAMGFVNADMKESLDATLLDIDEVKKMVFTLQSLS
jgi:copper homeostasis protein